MIALAGIGPRALLIAATIGSVFFVGWSVRGRIAASDIAKLEKAHLQVVAAAAEAARLETERVRAKEAVLVKNLEDAVNVARELEKQRDVASRSADVARSGMLNAARSALGRCTPAAAPSAAGGGAGPGVPGGMSDADRFLLVLGRIDSFAGVSALDSVRARDALEVCRGAYESARKVTTP